MAVNCEKAVGDLLAAWTRLNLDEVMSCRVGQRPECPCQRQTGDP